MKGLKERIGNGIWQQKYMQNLKTVNSGTKPFGLSFLFYEGHSEAKSSAKNLHCMPAALCLA